MIPRGAKHSISWVDRERLKGNLDLLLLSVLWSGPAAAVMAAWKLAALLATTVGAGGLAGMGIFTYMLRSAPGGPVPPVLVVYAAMAAGGLVLLATRRLTGHGTPGRDRLSPGTTASCFLLASAPLAALIVRLIVSGGARARIRCARPRPGPGWSWRCGPCVRVSPANGPSQKSSKPPDRQELGWS